MGKIVGDRRRVPKHFTWNVDLHKGTWEPGALLYWEPWGTTTPDATFVVHRFTARLLAGDRDALRIAASSMVAKIYVHGDEKWSRNLEHLVQTPLTEELETRIHRMEVVLNWLLQEETQASKTLQKLGAKPLKNTPLPLIPPGRLIKPVLVPPRQTLSVRIHTENKVEVVADATISFELHAIHSYEHIT